MDEQRKEELGVSWKTIDFDFVFLGGQRVMQRGNSSCVSDRYCHTTAIWQLMRL